MKIKRKETQSTKNSELVLDREINDQDLWLIQIDGKKMVKTKLSCEGMTGNGKVLMKFINKSGNNIEKFI